jgi:DNA-binding NtrC family response regulator
LQEKEGVDFRVAVGWGICDNAGMREMALKDLSVLVVEDDGLWRRQLTAYLERQGAEVTAVENCTSAREVVTGVVFDFALLDVHLPDGSGLDLLREGLISANTAVVVMTGDGGVKGAVEAMRLGARDYLAKPFEPGEVVLVLGRVRRNRQAQRVEEHRREDEALREDEFVFGSALAGIRSQLDRILAADRRMETGLAPVLVQGETGTGKTSIVRWLHEHGPRAAQPLVEVNCSALPDSLAESELFGHERGAFTDARTARLGLFEAAHGGTLFLDELPSLSPALQAKVLTTIEDGKIRRLGGNRTLTVDVRVMAAANQDLRVLVEAGKFRQDLWQRLDLFRLQLPPLRDRKADIVPLAGALLRRACRRHRLEAREISDEGRRRLEGYPWPGNVRELAHEVERALVFEDGALRFLQLPLAWTLGTEGAEGAGGGSGEEGMAGGETDWLRRGYVFPATGFSLDAAVDRLIRRALEQSQGNVSAAARLLGVSRDVVRYRMEGRPPKGRSGEAMLSAED